MATTSWVIPCYQEADALSRQNKEFIRALFPQDPLYATLLPPEVQELIGQVGPAHHRPGTEELGPAGEGLVGEGACRADAEKQHDGVLAELPRQQSDRLQRLTDHPPQHLGTRDVGRCHCRA